MGANGPVQRRCSKQQQCGRFDSDNLCPHLLCCAQLECLSKAAVQLIGVAVLLASGPDLFDGWLWNCPRLPFRSLVYCVMPGLTAFIEVLTSGVDLFADWRDAPDSPSIQATFVPFEAAADQ